MLKSNRGRSTARKPLADISNGGKPSRCSKKKVTGDGDDGGALDRLLLVRSDLSNLVRQIDELVAQALERNMISGTVSQDIESFRHLLSDMHSSLKLWVSRLQQSFGGASAAFVNQLGQPLEINSVSCSNGGGNVATNNKNESELDLIVSPSPLVSWRAGACTSESGRELFLLTPLPNPKIFSSKCPGSSKSMVGILHDKDQHANLELPPSSFLSKNAHDDLSERMEAKLASSNVMKPFTFGAKNSTSESTLIFPSKLSDHKCRKDSIFLLTPCSKTSPPKSSALLHPISENIPEPIQNNERKGSDDLTSGEASESLASRYQQPFNLQPTYNFTNRRKEVDETLDWFLSPPKTCVLMEPSDEKPVPTPANISGVLLATPVCMDVESTIRKGKQPGENTLKKELWTRFEAVSTDGLHFNASVFQKTTRKGFLDMLEEVSSETTDLDCKVTG